MTTNIRAITETDYIQWLVLFYGFCEFYHQPYDDIKGKTVFSWLMDSNHMLNGLVAEVEQGTLQGIAHYHAWPVTIYDCDVCYLSDLFVNPDSRGKGVGKKLYRRLMGESKAEGWAALTLLTQDDNRVARGLYDSYGERSDFGFYISPIT